MNKPTTYNRQKNESVSGGYHKSGITDSATLPYDEVAEKIILGTMLQRAPGFDQVRDLLTADMFYLDFHRIVYTTILSLDELGKNPDVVMVSNELRRTMGEQFSHDKLINIYGHYAPDIYQFALLVQEKAQRRHFFDVGHYLLGNCFSELTDIPEVISQSHRFLDAILMSSSDNSATLREAITGVYERINKNIQVEDSLTGSPTGFRDFDHLSGGLQKSDLIVIAAETSMGKTSLAVSMAMNTNARVAFYSLEMKKEQIAARMMAIESGIPANEILFRKLSTPQLKQVDKGVHRLEEKEFYFDDNSTANLDTIITSIRKMKKKYDIEGAVVDYLQILTVNRKVADATKEQQMGEAARRLKNLAMDLGIWIIALSQLNRDIAHPVPSINRLRDSGQIAEAADVVMLIYRAEVYGRGYPEPFCSAAVRNTALIDVAKGRNIGLAKFLCGFDKPTTRFYDIEVERERKAGEKAGAGKKKKAEGVEMYDKY